MVRNIKYCHVTILRFVGQNINLTHVEERNSEEVDEYFDKRMANRRPVQCLIRRGEYCLMFAMKKQNCLPGLLVKRNPKHVDEFKIINHSVKL